MRGPAAASNPDGGRIRDGERLAVERHVDARRRAEALPRERTGSASADAQLVGRIERKVVRQLEAAARAERQAVDVARLRAAGSLVN